MFIDSIYAPYAEKYDRRSWISGTKYVLILKYIILYSSPNIAGNLI